MREVPGSLASQRRATERLLLGLLRLPKTRPGLIAAVSGKTLTRRFIFGWLSDRVRTGVVVELKSTRPFTYQLAATHSEELPAAGSYPLWLEPRTLPTSVGRVAYIDGQRVQPLPPKKKKIRRKPKCA